jgi:NADPH:quinone reductase-like Zn-dependent oxidoreductase
MKAVHVTPSDGIGGLQVVERTVPRPGPGEVLVRMKAASLNFRDLAVVTGRYARTPIKAGLIPLSDGSGEVVECGTSVTRVAVGDRVAAQMVQTWIEGDVSNEYTSSVLGGEREGVLAEYVVFPEAGLVQLPSHLSYQEGATLPCAGLTAWNALHALRPLRATESVLVLGTGGVALFAVQFAAAVGANVIVTSSSDAKIAQAQDLGATHGINYATQLEWQDEVLRLTNGRGVDHTVETAGAGTLSRSVAATRFGGFIHLIGAMTTGEVQPNAIMRRAVMVRGVMVGSRTMFEAMNQTIEHYSIRPVIDKVFPLNDIQEAFNYFRLPRRLGKVVIDID